MLEKALGMVTLAYNNFRQNSDLTHPDTTFAARAMRRLERKLMEIKLNQKEDKDWHSLMEKMYKRKWNGPLIDSGRQITENKIRIMHWNLLADKLAYPDFKKGGFGCPFELLDWEHERKDKVIAEIICYNPDVLVLVELDHYEDIRLVLQEDFGYQSVWKKKNNNFYTDGTGIFWKNDKFDSATIYKKPLAKELGSQEEADQVFVAVELHPKNDSEKFTPFVVGGCHLKSTKKAKGEKKRLDQSKQIANILATEFKGLPVILGSDMNAEATAKNYEPLAYPYIVNNGMISAYATVLGKEPEYTSWKFRLDEYNDLFSEDKVLEWKYTIDFIFHTDNLKTLSVLDVPEEKEIDKAYGEPRKESEDRMAYARRRMLLPNERCPSDHVPILAEILLPTNQVVGEDEKQN